MVLRIGNCQKAGAWNHQGRKGEALVRAWLTHYRFAVAPSGDLIPGRVADLLIGIYVSAVEMARMAFQRDEWTGTYPKAGALGPILALVIVLHMD